MEKDEKALTSPYGLKFDARKKSDHIKQKQCRYLYSYTNESEKIVQN